MEVRHDEGVANRTDPEPCVCIREGKGEASVGEITGHMRINLAPSQIPHLGDEK